MKILLLSPLPPPEGGMATWTLKYKKYCETMKKDITIINIALTGKRSNNFTFKKSIFEEIMRTYKIIKNTSNTIKKNRPDIVHLNTSCSKLGIIRDYYCAKIINKNKIPLVIQCHCNVSRVVTTKIQRVFLRKMIEYSQLVYVLNRESQDYINRIDSSKVEIIPNFVDENQISESKIISEKVKKIVFVGHVHEAKGCKEIIRAAYEMQDTIFYLVGAVDENIKSLTVTKNVIFTDKQPQSIVKEYLTNADIFLLPSYSEGFSMAIIEAMAMGVPIITTDVGGNRGAIEDKGGKIIPTGDYLAIINAINEMDSSKIRSDMSKWNIEKVKENYTTNSVMQKFFFDYLQCIDKYNFLNKDI